MVPPKLSGKEFETALMDAAKRHEAEGALTMGRYGVQAMHLGKDKVITVPSLPDFEGVLATGRQFIIEAKAVAGSSLPLKSDHFRGRQYAHLAKRSEFGASCWLAIHFSARRLVNSIQPAMTLAVPVDRSMPFWQAYETGETATLHRDTAHQIGSVIPWRIPKGCRKPLPDLVALLWPESRRIELQTLTLSHD
ncbi:MAG: hypothetical protein LLG20_22790 [Acidobacteriales bacterium]|nr:hypothetical protein [Terriglobales bacterium]